MRLKFEWMCATRCGGLCLTERTHVIMIGVASTCLAFSMTWSDQGSNATRYINFITDPNHGRILTSYRRMSFWLEWLLHA